MGSKPPAIEVQLHRRQFIIGPRPVDVGPGWQNVPVPEVGYLSHAPELPVAAIAQANAQTSYLLGLAVRTVRASDPADEVGAAKADTVAKVYAAWAGRWVLLIGGQLHLDSAGLLGCFYVVRDSPLGDRELWVSSSSALLRQVLRIDDGPVRTIHHGVGIDWYPPPGSRFKTIRRLLPSQILELRGGALLPRALLPVNLGVSTYDQILDRLQAELIGAVRSAAERTGSLWLSLTAGHDTRTLLATAMYAGIPVRTYTQTSIYMRDHDRIVPPKLAAVAGAPHTFYARGKGRPDLLTLFDAHTGGLTVDRDRDFFAHQQFGWSQPNDIILRGFGFEVGRCKYRNRFPGPGTWSATPSASVVIKGFKESMSPSIRSPIEEWVAWTREHPEPAMDWRDRFHLEMRLAGWASSVEQALDLVEGHMFHPANSHSFYADVLQVPEAKRCRALHQEDLIRRMAPELLEFAFNAPGPTYRRVVRRALRASEYLGSIAASLRRR